MRYAIDRFRIGAEHEVSADTFYATYISQKNSRFFCPECGEPVYWSSRGGSQPDKFSHYNKTEQSPECDRRVDGRSGLNLYERIGLPVYLTIGEENQCCLNIGFPAIGEELLAEAASQNTKIYIAGAGYQRTIFVNSTNFFEKDITLVPVDFIPHLGKNYAIRIDFMGETEEFRKKWSDYADGFDCGGAIFTYEETGGKKVRRGDSISPDRQYYVIAKQFHPPCGEISFQTIGTIPLNREVYKVYLMKINVSIDNSSRFSTVNHYLRERFGIWLLQTSPELIPLWPPVVEQGTMIPVKKYSKIYCSVSSGNDSPNAYVYDGNDVSQIDVKKDCKGYNSLVFAMHTQEMTISVDRKYVGREITFERKDITYPNFTYDISLARGNEISISPQEITKEILSADFTINVNAKMEAYIGCHDKIYQHIAVRNCSVIVPARRNSEELFFMVEDGVLFHFCASTILPKMDSDEQITVSRIKKCCKGEKVAVPKWVETFVLGLQKKGYYTMVSAVQNAICKGKVPIGLLKLLIEQEIE